MFVFFPVDCGIEGLPVGFLGNEDSTMTLVELYTFFWLELVKTIVLLAVFYSSIGSVPKGLEVIEESGWR